LARNRSLPQGVGSEQGGRGRDPIPEGKPARQIEESVETSPRMASPGSIPRPATATIKTMEESLMPSPPALLPGTLESLKDLTRLVQTTEGFHPLVASLKNGHGGTIDGVWGSANALAAAALGLHAPRTILLVLAHPRDIDGWIADLTSFAGLPPA